MWDETKCNRCLECLRRCKYIDKEKYDEKKMMKEINALIEGKDTDILRDCIVCRACNEYCPKGADPFDRIAELHEKFGMIFVPEMATFDRMQYWPNRVIKGESDKPVLCLCIMEPGMYPHRTFEGQMFDGLTVVRGGDYFCASGIVLGGGWNRMRELVKRFVDNLAKLEAEEIIFPHDDCYGTLTHLAPGWGIEVPFKYVHIFEYMRDYLKEHQDRITKLNKKVAYQRNCMSRYIPREIFAVLDEVFELIGVERVARKYDREDALCCAGVIADPERRTNIQDMNVIDAKVHGAEAMTFVCGGCAAISMACYRHGLAPIYLVNLVRMALGEKRYPA